MRALTLIGRAWKRAKSKNINLRFTSVAQKRLCLSSLITKLNAGVHIKTHHFFKIFSWNILISENPAYASVHNFVKMHALDGKVLRLKHKTYLEQQILKISVQLDKFFSKYVSVKGINNLFWEKKLWTYYSNWNSQNKTSVP